MFFVARNKKGKTEKIFFMAKLFGFRIAFRCNSEQFNYGNKLFRIILHLYSFVLQLAIMLIELYL